MTRKFVVALIFLMIVGAGVGIMLLLSSAKKEPKHKEVEDKAAVVAALAAEPSDAPVVISAMGSVVPARQVVITPEVSGRIVYQSPQLVPGGRFNKGQVLVRLDARDYELALEQQKASVSQAELNLARERSLKDVAEKEWELVGDSIKPTELGRQLALRDIQVHTAEVSLESAKSALAKAELMRSRTVIRAPFNSVVLDEFVDQGQVLGPGTKIAVLADVDKYWVRASVPVEKLVWIQVPGVNSEQGSSVSIIQMSGQDSAIERQGRVIRLLPDLDPRGKMARVLIEVESPWNNELGARRSSADKIEDLGSNKDGAPGADVPTPHEQLKSDIPLFIGSWVNVRIKGPRMDNVLKLPRMALRDRTKVWVKNSKSELEIRSVKVVWSHGDTVFVSGDLKPGEDVITSRLSVPVEGMKVETVSGDDGEKLVEKAGGGDEQEKRL